MDKALLRGMGVAVVTPFTQNFEVDYNALKKIIHHLLNGGVDYLVALGTTAEISTLTEAEKQKIINCFVNEVDNKIPLIIGIGGNSTQAVIQQVKVFEQFKYDAILSVSPYYNRPSQQAIFHHYKAIANATTKPIILYNVPARTGSNIDAATTLKLAETFRNIIGVKEASANLNQIMQIIANKPSGFLVISGDDALTIPIIAAGGDGLISVVANAFPKDWVAIVNQALQQNFNTANPIYYKYLNVLEGIYREGNPTGVKCVLNQLGLCDNVLRLPLIAASEGLKEDLNRLVKLL